MQRMSPLEAKVWKLIASKGWVSKTEILTHFDSRGDVALSGLQQKKLIKRATRDGVVGVELK